MNTHSQQLERWMGTDEVEKLSLSMRGWYGPPVAVSGVPGAVYACGDGDFTGRIYGGFEATARCYLNELARRARRAARSRATFHAGFATVTALLAAGSNGHRQTIPFNKTLATVTNSNALASSWAQGNTPAAATVAAAAAPGGTAWTSVSSGAATFNNARTGERSFYVGGWNQGSALVGPTLLYDRLFSVVKTMNSTATEAVTGVPTRYQSTTATDPDYAAGNFLIIDATTTLAATAHNWTVCKYTDQDGNTNATLPSVVGVTTCAGFRLDMPTGSWFCPLAAGDTGVKALTQMQCDATVATGGIDFTIGHPLAWIPNYLVNQPWFLPDGIRSAFNLARIFDDAALTFLHWGAVGATTINGSFDIVSG